MINNKRIAIVGLGRMGARHVTAAEMRGHTITALIDPSDNPFAIEQAPNLRPLHLSSIEELDPSHCDAIVIATTADLHLPLVETAIALGHRRIVVEKPATQSLADAKRMADLSLAARIIINHGRRYCEGYQRLKRLGETEYGGLRTITLRFGGGALGCVGSHWIDLANMLAGSKVRSVFATQTTPNEANPRGVRFNDPGASVMLTYDNGITAFIDIRDDIGFIGGASFSFPLGDVSWTDEFGPWTARFRTAADRTRPLSQYGLPLASTVFAPSETARDLSSRSAWPYSGATAVLNYAASALDDALSDGEPVCGMQQAVETIAVFVAARISAESGIAVSPSHLDADAESKRYPIP